jgi:hypothetical protein
VDKLALGQIFLQVVFFWLLLEEEKILANPENSKEGIFFGKSWDVGYKSTSDLQSVNFIKHFQNFG